MAIADDSELADNSITLTQAGKEILCSIVLSSAGTAKLAIVKLVNEKLGLGLGLKASKQLVDSAPVTLKDNVPIAEAKIIKGLFEAEGAIVKLK